MTNMPTTQGPQQNLPAKGEAGFTLGKLIQNNTKAIAAVLPKHVTPERMARMALAEARRNPKRPRGNSSACGSDSRACGSCGRTSTWWPPSPAPSAASPAAP